MSCSRGISGESNFLQEMSTEMRQFLYQQSAHTLKFFSPLLETEMHYWTLSVEIFLFFSTCRSVFFYRYLIVCNYRSGKCVQTIISGNQLSLSLTHTTHSHTVIITAENSPHFVCCFACLIAYACLILGLNL